MIRPFVYRPTYQSLPMEEIGKLFDNTEKSYIENRDNFTKLSAALSQIKGNDADNEYIKTVGDKYKKQIESLADTVQKRKDWSLAEDTIRDMALEIGTDQKLNAIKESYANYLDEEKRRQEFMAKGITTLDFSNYANHKNWDENGKINIYRSRIEPKANYFNTVSDIWAKVKPDSDESGFKKSDLPFYLENELTVSNVPKIKALQDTAVSMFKNDAAGQQFIKKLKMERPDASDAAIEEAVRTYVRDVSRLHEQTQNKVEYQADKMQELEYKAQQQVDVYKQKLQIKAGMKSNNVDGDGNHQLVELQSSVHNKAGTESGITAFINNGTVADNIAKTHLSSNSLDKSNVKFIGDVPDDFMSGKVEVKPIGFQIVNPTGDASFDGAIVADITGKDGVTKRGFVRIGDQNKYRQITRTAKNAHYAMVSADYSNAPHVNIADESGLIRVRDAQGNETSVETGFEILSDDKKNWQKSNKRLVPLYKGADGKWHKFTKEELDRSFIKESYLPNEIYQETSNMIGMSLEPMTRTTKSINQ